jgi:hypothetical protein
MVMSSLSERGVAAAREGTPHAFTQHARFSHPRRPRAEKIAVASTHTDTHTRSQEDEVDVGLSGSNEGYKRCGR